MPSAVIDAPHHGRASTNGSPLWHHGCIAGFLMRAPGGCHLQNSMTRPLRRSHFRMCSILPCIQDESMCLPSWAVISTTTSTMCGWLSMTNTRLANVATNRTRLMDQSMPLQSVGSLPHDLAMPVIFNIEATNLYFASPTTASHLDLVS